LAHLIISEIDSVRRIVRHMKFDTFGRVAEILECDRERDLVVQMEDKEEHPELNMILDRLVAIKMHVMIQAENVRACRLAKKHVHLIYDVAQVTRQLDEDPRALEKLRETGRLMELFSAMPSAGAGVKETLRLAEHLPEIRAVTVGSGWESRNSGPVKDLTAHDPEWGSSLVIFASELTQRRIKMHFACGLPLCLFTREQMGNLAAMNIRWPIAMCSPEVRIDLAGDVRHCLRLGSPEPLNVFKRGSLKGIRETFDKWTKMRGICLRAPRVSCRSLKTAACGGGCLADSLDRWHGGGMASWS